MSELTSVREAFWSLYFPQYLQVSHQETRQRLITGEAVDADDIEKVYEQYSSQLIGFVFPLQSPDEDDAPPKTSSDIVQHLQSLLSTESSLALQLIQYRSQLLSRLSPPHSTSMTPTQLQLPRPPDLQDLISRTKLSTATLSTSSLKLSLLSLQAQQTLSRSLKVLTDSINDHTSSVTSEIARLSKKVEEYEGEGGVDMELVKEWKKLEREEEDLEEELRRLKFEGRLFERLG